MMYHHIVCLDHPMCRLTPGEISQLEEALPPLFFLLDRCAALSSFLFNEPGSILMGYCPTNDNHHYAVWNKRGDVYTRLHPLYAENYNATMAEEVIDRVKELGPWGRKLTHHIAQLNFDRPTGLLQKWSLDPSRFYYGSMIERVPSHHEALDIMIG